MSHCSRVKAASGSRQKPHSSACTSADSLKIDRQKENFVNCLLKIRARKKDSLHGKAVPAAVVVNVIDLAHAGCGEVHVWQCGRHGRGWSCLKQGAVGATSADADDGAIVAVGPHVPLGDEEAVCSRMAAASGTACYRGRRCSGREGSWPAVGRSWWCNWAACNKGGDYGAEKREQQSGCSSGCWMQSVMHDCAFECTCSAIRYVLVHAFCMQAGSRQQAAAARHEGKHSSAVSKRKNNLGRRW